MSMQYSADCEVYFIGTYSAPHLAASNVRYRTQETMSVHMICVLMISDGL